VKLGLAGLVLAASLGGAARAQSWANVDGAGVAHVAPTQFDSRYRRLLGEPGKGSGAAQVPGKADGTDGLLLRLQIVPELKALAPLLREVSVPHGVDEELLKAIIAVESGFNAKAVSPRSAVGLMQIAPMTADRHSTKADAKTPAVTRLLEARVNLNTGVCILADLLRRFGSIDIALAAWSAGESTVRRHGGMLLPIDETRAYVQIVLELDRALLQERQSRHATEVRIQPAR
jgi:soluble lytic murein transglycosylase-like protein